MRMTVFFILSFLTFFSLTAKAKPIKVEQVTVFHSKTCGCCKKWMGLLEKNGFPVLSKEVSDVMSVKTNLKVPGGLASCHTAVVGGYIVEGHVPIIAISKLLKERPKIRGIGVAGMPMGSPGMEGPYTEIYSVSSFTEEIQSKAFMEL